MITPALVPTQAATYHVIHKYKYDTHHRVTTSLLYVFVGIDFARARPVNRFTAQFHCSKSLTASIRLNQQSARHLVSLFQFNVT